jgi:hypothetical protein
MERGRPIVHKKEPRNDGEVLVLSLSIGLGLAMLAPYAFLIFVLMLMVPLATLAADAFAMLAFAFIDSYDARLGLRNRRERFNRRCRGAIESKCRDSKC